MSSRSSHSSSANGHQSEDGVDAGNLSTTTPAVPADVGVQSTLRTAGQNESDRESEGSPAVLKAAAGSSSDGGTPSLPPSGEPYLAVCPARLPSHQSGSERSGSSRSSTHRSNRSNRSSRSNRSGHDANKSDSGTSGSPHHSTIELKKSNDNSTSSTNTHDMRKFSSTSSEKENSKAMFGSPGNVVHTLRKCLKHTEAESSTDSDTDALKWLKDSAVGQAKPAVMRVRYNKVPRTSKDPKWEYPYHPLSEKAIAYRGYPVDGPKAITKTKKWRVQIAGAALGKPTEPLPQFPQQEVLRRIDGVYQGAPKMELTKEQVAWNSGEAWLTNSKTRPTSSYFYTAGYLPGSAVQVTKPFKESIYHTVVSGTAVEVPATDIAGDLENKMENKLVDRLDSYEASSVSS